MEQKQLKRAKKGLLSMIFSRTGCILLLILIQLGAMLVSVIYLRQYMVYTNIAIRLLSVGVLVYIINEETNSAFEITWALCVMAFPTIGTLFYLYVKLQPGTRWVGTKLEQLKEETSAYMKQDPLVLKELRSEVPSSGNLAYYLSQRMKYPVYKNTKLEFYSLGEYKYEAMLEELNRARKFIFMEYFIISRGEVWDTLLAILRKKAREGVEVRLMFDGMCTIQEFPHDYYKDLEMMGIKCRVSNPIIPFVSTVQNNRDHRKICVIDGKVGFTGGVNLADEYINAIDRFGHWKDTAVKLEGGAVQSLTMMFLEMWNLESGEKENYRKYLSPNFRDFSERRCGYVIPYADHPHDSENVGEEVYFHILNNAQKYVHIMTPYLILDSEMLATLTRAAKCGVEVSIIMPHIPDKKYAFAVAKTYYKELIQNGVQIYEYTPGFVHAKIFVSDDETATVGTINLDYRSLYLHYECGTLILNDPVVREIEEDFQETLKKCQKISLTEVKNRPTGERIMGQVLRFVAPLM